MGNLLVAQYNADRHEVQPESCLLRQRGAQSSGRVSRFEVKRSFAAQAGRDYLSSGLSALNTSAAAAPPRKSAVR
jgi:hypothetical protein